VIEEVTTTIVIEPGWRVSLHESGVYVLSVDADNPAAPGDAQKELTRA